MKVFIALEVFYAETKVLGVYRTIDQAKAVIAGLLDSEIIQWKKFPTNKDTIYAVENNLLTACEIKESFLGD